MRPGIVGDDLDVDVEQITHDLLGEPFAHGVEHLGTLTLVFDERVTLGHRPQADALAEVVHLVQMLTPLAVEHRQPDLAFQLAHVLRAERLLSGVIGPGGVLREGVGELLRIVLTEVVVNFEVDREEFAHLSPQSVEVPVVRQPGGVLQDPGPNHTIDSLTQLLVDRVAAEHLAPITIDGVPLTVHHVVVLQDVLAHLEVLGLDLLLRALDGLRDDLHVDRLIVGQIHRQHGAFDDVGLEKPQQIVLERQVEPALAGIALTSGTTTQLVVDAP